MVNQGTGMAALGARGVHVNAYFGDVTGDGTIDGLDVATAAAVAQGAATGFAAYPLLDPAIVGDVALDLSVDAGDVSTLAAFVSHLNPMQIPALPTGSAIPPPGAAPVTSISQGSVHQTDELSPPSPLMI